MAHPRPRTGFVFSLLFAALTIVGVAVALAEREPKPTYANNATGPVPAAAVPATAAPSPKAIDPTQETVYITRTGKKYHRKDCRWAKEGIAMPLAAAAEKYLPCSVCVPPKLERQPFVQSPAQPEPKPSLPPEPTAKPAVVAEHKALPPVAVTEAPPTTTVEEGPLDESPKAEKPEDVVVIEERHEPFVPPVPIKPAVSISERSEKRPVAAASEPKRSTTTVVKSYQSRPSNCPPSRSRGFRRR